MLHLPEQADLTHIAVLHVTVCSRAIGAYLEALQADLQSIRQDLKSTAAHGINILVAAVTTVLVVAIERFLPHVCCHRRLNAVDAIRQLQR